MRGIPGDEAAAGLMALQLLEGRRARDAVFEGYGDGFGEPAWDTLLLLFCAQSQGQGAVPVADVLAETDTREQTVMAYLGWLETQDLVTMAADHAQLTARGTSLMMEYLKGEIR